MSGAKVVRIVTAEEKQQIVQQHQRALLFALNKFRNFAQSNDQLSSKLSDTLKTRHQEYEALGIDDYGSIEPYANAQTSFFSAKLEKLENELIDKQLQDKQSARKIKIAANGLKNAFQQRNLAIPDSITKLTNLSLTESLKSISFHEQALQKALHLLMAEVSSEQSEQPLSSEFKSLLSRLNTNSSIESVSSWVNTQQPIINKQQQRIDKLLSKLEIMQTTMTSPLAIEDFISRAETIEKQQQETPSSQQSLFLDSLILEVSHFIQNQQQYIQTFEHLEQSLLELRNISDTTQSTNDLISIIEKTLASSKHEEKELALLQQQTDIHIEKYSTQQIADSRRSTVINGLQALGYEVNDNMSSAWVENGRLVVKRSEEDEYGIELTTNPDMHRLQARVVVNSDASKRSNESDNQAEEVWCGDFSGLRKEVELQNGQIIIDRAMAIGSQKLKEVDGQTKMDEERLRRSQQRKLRAKQQSNN